MTLFPPEIINNSTELHFVRNTTRSKIIYQIVLLMLILLIAATPFIYLDITAQAQGIIRTPNNNSILQAVVYAQVEEVYIQENYEVNKGDTLVTLNTDKINEQIRRHKEKLDENIAFITDIETILSSKSHCSTPKYRAEANAYLTTLTEKETHISYLKTEYERYKDLFQKGVTPQQEYLQYKSNYDNACTQLNNQKEQLILNWETERTRLTIENKEISSTINQLQEEKIHYIITAPTSGSIIQFSGLQKGNFTVPNQTIAKITSTNNLLVECYVSPLDIGYIHKGQNASFQLSAFDYNQWGFAHGNVIEISKDIVNVNDQAVFCVRCTLNNTYLELKNGYQGELKKGMTLTGRFILTRRSLWQLAFDKIDDWMNPKNIKN